MALSRLRDVTRVTGKKGNDVRGAFETWLACCN